MLAPSERTTARLYRAARADRWTLTPARFRLALAESAERAFRGAAPTERELDRYLGGLHLEDLALACACADGVEDAWDAVVRQHRPALYRSAAALDSSGGARELADGLFGELYARSLFRYYHGRSSLITWLRSVLAQRHVDSIRSRRRMEPLPDDGTAPAAAAARGDPESPRYYDLMARALAGAVSRLPPRDRLRLRCYYAQQMTLAEIGRLLREHEATVSRSLARARTAVRADMERTLRTAGLHADEIARCFEVSREDAGPLDLDRVFSGAPPRKLPHPDRSE